MDQTEKVRKKRGKYKMKKCIAAIMAASLILAMAGCKKSEETTTTTTTAATTTTEATTTESTTEATTEESTTEASSEDTSASSEASSETSAEAGKVLSYSEYAAAALETEVTIEAYVQAKQSWWDNKATVYLQDENGAYFAYNMTCSEEDYAKLTDGQKIRVKGFKSEWSGEVEIVDATFEVIDGNWKATPVDVTADLGTDGLIDKQNQLVSFTGMKVEASKDASFTSGTVPVQKVMTSTSTFPLMVRPIPLRLSPTSAIRILKFIRQSRDSKSATQSIWKVSCTGTRA